MFVRILCLECLHGAEAALYPTKKAPGAVLGHRHARFLRADRGIAMADYRRGNENTRTVREADYQFEVREYYLTALIAIKASESDDVAPVAGVVGGVGVIYADSGGAEVEGGRGVHAVVEVEA